MSLRYITGGTLPPDSPAYIERPCDRELPEVCRGGEFAYVLSSRQMGKSSLMARTAEVLRREGIAVATLDLTRIGSQNLSAEAWYLGLLTDIDAACAPQTDLFDWWQAHANLGPAHRFSLYLSDVLLAETPGRLVVFVDEIDSTLGMAFTDDFFATIRALHNQRAEKPELARLSFVLLGVATPGELIRDTSRTPFNIGCRVEVTDFTPDEARPLAAALPQNLGDTEALLTEILHWTGGQPYLTQKLCELLAKADAKPAQASERVADLVRSAFLSPTGRADAHFQFVGDYLQQTPNDEQATLFEVIEHVLKGRKVACRDTSPSHNRLRLSGLMRRHDGLLRLRNRIYGQLFDLAWVKKHRPTFWTKANKQLAAALAVAVLVALGFGWLYQRAEEAKAQVEQANAQLKQAEDQLKQAEDQLKQAEDQALSDRHKADLAIIEARKARFDAVQKTGNCESISHRPVGSH